MSVDTLNTANTTYFVDSNDTTISVPSGLYEASTTGSFSVASAGSSFFIEGSKREVCLADGLSSVTSVGSLLPTSWQLANYDSGSAALSVVDAVRAGSTLRGITANLARMSSTNGTNWTFDGAYTATAAAPTVVWTTSADAQGNANFTLNFPAGTQTGDVVIVSVGSDSSTPNTPAGWTSLENQTSNSDSFGRTIYKVMGDTVDTSVAITGMSDASAMVAIAVRGVFNANAVPGITVQSTTFVGTQPNPPSITTVGNNALVVALARVDDNSVAIGSITAPTGYTNLTTAQAAGLIGQTVMLATRVVPTSGTSEDPTSFTVSGVLDAGTAITIALQSAFFNGTVSHLEFANNQYFSTSGEGSFLRSSDLSYWEHAGKNTNNISLLPTFITTGGTNWTSTQSNNNFSSFGATARAGDVVFAFIQSNSGPSGVSLNDSGWVQIMSNSNNGGHRAFYRIVTSSEPANYSFSSTNTTGLIFTQLWRNIDLNAIRNSSSWWAGPTGRGTSSNRLSDSPTMLSTGAPSRVLAVFFASSSQGNPPTAGTFSSTSGYDTGANGHVISAFSIAGQASGSTFSGINVFTSATSQTYTSFTLAIPGVLPTNSMAFGNGIYVYAGTGGSLYTSTNGTFFTERTTPFTSGVAIQKAAFLNGKFWITSATGGIASSTNGTTWTLASTGVTSAIVDIVYEEGVLFATTVDGVGLRSSNETTWVQVTAPATSAASVPSILWMTRSDMNTTDGPNSIQFGTGLRAGDTVFVYVTQTSSAQSNFPLIPEVLSSGWECIKTHSRFNNSSFTTSVFVFRKVMGTIPDAGFTIGGTVTLITSTTNVFTSTKGMSAIAIRGVDQSAAITYASDNTWSGTTSASFNSVTPSVANSVIVAFTGQSNAMTANTVSAGYTQNAAGQNVHSTIASRLYTGTAAETPGFWTMNSSNNGLTGVMAVPLTGPAGGATSSVAVTELAYRRPFFVTFNSAGSITDALSTDSAFTGVAANLAVGVRRVVDIGRRLVALGSDGKFYSSGEVIETLTLKKLGEVVKV